MNVMLAENASDTATRKIGLIFKIIKIAEMLMRSDAKIVIRRRKMSKEFRCNLCKKKVITEKEDTRHTAYTYGICEECQPKPEAEAAPAEVETKEKPNPLACKVCGRVCKNKGGLKAHKKSHKA